MNSLCFFFRCRSVVLNAEISAILSLNYGKPLAFICNPVMPDGHAEKLTIVKERCFI